MQGRRSPAYPRGYGHKAGFLLKYNFGVFKMTLYLILCHSLIILIMCFISINEVLSKHFLINVEGRSLKLCYPMHMFLVAEVHPFILPGLLATVPTIQEEVEPPAVEDSSAHSNTGTTGLSCLDYVLG